MSVFYERFERHAHGEGVKGRSTHYCAGCGHGLAHKYLAEAIDDLGVQDRTIAISPVGCAVFLYYYFDVGNTQASHGRAPAVAIGHKMANPDSVIVSYQGDGDLAAIGLAEIIQAAQLGVPITVVFVNNAVYGMTGGQLAPTTPLGHATATSPAGRDLSMGAPLKMTEMIAAIDGCVYAERVALFDNKERITAKRAIRKALALQLENRGLSFVEVLSECPTHLKMSPRESQRWVRETMVRIFPLGVKKDVKSGRWPAPPPPNFDSARMVEVIGGFADHVESRDAKLPSELGDEVGLKFAGSGGDGAQTAAMLVTRAAIHEGFDATHIPSYGPESRGGTSYADVRIAVDEVLSPAVTAPNVLVAFNAPSLAKFGPHVLPGGTIIYDSSVITERPQQRDEVNCIGVPCAEIAAGLGKAVVKNIVALGALQAATRVLPEKVFIDVIRLALKSKPKLLPINEEAFRRGAEMVANARTSPS
ncbi:MAG: 2-oxoacid:acceptor oxidoreductase family protein [Vicinamibacteria bacterium]|nr:2-oxoacid:acceptor oxidoreductase family protein [Vicinamibacteria bacterium]